MKHTYYGHLTSNEAKLAVKKKYILVLPIGAIEQHGPHLPIDTDDWLALRAAKEGVELAVKKYKTKAMYLPGIHFGQSFSHLAWPGRISLSFSTFVSIIYEVIDQLVYEGFKKFVIVNGNGGNEPSIITAIRQVTEKWREEKKYIKIFIDHHYLKTFLKKLINSLKIKVMKVKYMQVQEKHPGIFQEDLNLLDLILLKSQKLKK